MDSGGRGEPGKIMTTLESPMQAAYRDRANTLPKKSIWKVQESLIRAGKRPPKEEVVKGLKELSREIGRITNTITELAQITEASSKTKVEIKNTVKKLKRQANDLNREWKIISRREETNTVKPKERVTKSIGVQVDVKDIINEREEERLKMTNKIKTILEEKQNYESLAEVLDEKWPQELFKVTETVGGNQLDIKGDYAILMDPNNIEGSKLVDNLRLKRPKSRQRGTNMSKTAVLDTSSPCAFKQEVDIQATGVKIKKLRKTGKGDLLLAVEGGQEMASTLEKEIRSKIDDVKVSTRTTATTTIYILGLDPTTKDDEIKRALVTETKLAATDINIIALRKGKYEDQTAIVEIPKSQAMALKT
ncbi:hypothetical protein QE152_g40368 [Popillia japonica]|uniref:Uncharacterized protein n=1 Tax=Popillia japonica TaxID=7064 RepID=A0AAW1HRJ1_POPJA